MHCVCPRQRGQGGEDVQRHARLARRMIMITGIICITITIIISIMIIVIITTTVSITSIIYCNY